jgi:major membrane immunogen (membrane-anchored lipoprotein)
MESTNVNYKSMSVKMQRLFMIIVAIMMALVTFTACDEDDENDGDEGNGSGVSVSGKRIKSREQTTGPIGDGPVRADENYNSDGTPKRTDWYDAQSKPAGYDIFTCNPDGTVSKTESYNSSNELTQVTNFSYDSNNKLLKAQGISYFGSIENPFTYDYTYQNGKIIRMVVKMVGVEIVFEYNYDSNGRRTSMTQSNSDGIIIQYTYTYRSDGTLHKVTYPYGYNGNTEITWEYTWENGKTKGNYGDIFSF